ncbi:hypothetical protein BC827DRAFT_1201286 [Russula dissimulans]|nr:hypothetical protein BC827DRAFT_1201286 [Russula dissimulans]
MGHTVRDCQAWGRMRTRKSVPICRMMCAKTRTLSATAISARIDMTVRVDSSGVMIAIVRQKPLWIVSKRWRVMCAGMRWDRLGDRSPCINYLAVAASLKFLGRSSTKVWGRLKRDRLSESVFAQLTTHPPSHFVFNASRDIRHGVYMCISSGVCSTFPSTFNTAPDIISKLTRRFSKLADQLGLET